MNPFTAPRARTIFAATAVLLPSVDGMVLRGQNVAAPPPVPWPTPPLPEGPILLRELKQRIRDVRQGPDGLLYVLTSDNPGALIRLEPAGASGTAATR